MWDLTLSFSVLLRFELGRNYRRSSSVWFHEYNKKSFWTLTFLQTLDCVQASSNKHTTTIKRSTFSWSWFISIDLHFSLNNIFAQNNIKLFNFSLNININRTYSRIKPEYLTNALSNATIKSQNKNQNKRFILSFNPFTSWVCKWSFSRRQDYTLCLFFGRKMYVRAIATAEYRSSANTRVYITFYNRDLATNSKIWSI